MTFRCTSYDDVICYVVLERIVIHTIALLSRVIEFAKTNILSILAAAHPPRRRATIKTAARRREAKTLAISSLSTVNCIFTFERCRYCFQRDRC